MGKSTIIPFLKERLSDKYDVHDFDEKLTEEVALNNSLLDPWRKETTLYWINLAEENNKSGISTVVVGLIYPKEVMEIKTEIPISFALLHASDKSIEDRLMGKRFSDTHKIQGLKKATGKTPEEFIEENKLLIENLRSEIKAVKGTIFDTTNENPEQTANKIVSWIWENSQKIRESDNMDL